MSFPQLPAPESDEQYLAWALQAAFVSTRVEARLCYSLAYARIARAEGFGRDEQFWLEVSRQVRKHFGIEDNNGQEQNQRIGGS